MSTTTHYTPAELEALLNRICDPRIIGESCEILMYAAEYGILEPVQGSRDQHEPHQENGV